MDLYFYRWWGGGHVVQGYITIWGYKKHTSKKRVHLEMHYGKQDVLRKFTGFCYARPHNNLWEDSVVI